MRVSSDYPQPLGRLSVPTYEYLCETNGKVVEVNHKMVDKVATWGDLCARAGISPGATKADSPVIKLISAGFVNTGGASAREPSVPFCPSGAPCSRGACGLS